MMIQNAGMKVGAVVWVDLERSALGLRSRAADLLGGEAILRRTLRRLERAERLDEILVFCPAGQAAAVSSLVEGTEAAVCPVKAPAAVSGNVRRRKWSLSGWRGGLGAVTCFDEQSITVEMVQEAQSRQIMLVVQAPAEAVFVDPQLIDGMIEHHHQHSNDMRFTFAHTAPGLSGCAYRLDLLAEMVAAPATIGTLLAYDPERPRSDFINHECTYGVSPELSGSPFRYLADTQRSVEVMEGMAGGDSSDWDAQRVVASVEAQLGKAVAFPAELEIEINTARSLRMADYPHGRADIERGPMGLSLFEKIIADCGGYDDICITLGGIGEPLAHEGLAEMIAAAKRGGIFGINIETDGKRLCGEVAEALLASAADTISVYLDANSAELYREVKGTDGFEAVVEQVEAFVERSHGGGGPLVVPHLVKSRETMAEMESFYDRWVRRCGFAVIAGYNDFAGQIADRAAMDMSPPRRLPCRRLFRSMTVLADGTVPICGQDFGGKGVVGNVAEQSVEAIWRSEGMGKVRRGHKEGDYGVNGLCGGCKEWHR